MFSTETRKFTGNYRRFLYGKPCETKVARTVQSGGKAGDNFKGLPIAIGFPCQGFSLSEPRKTNDAKNKLYRQYARVLKAKQPAMFAAENVKSVLTIEEGRVINAVQKQKTSEVSYTIPATAKQVPLWSGSPEMTKINKNHWKFGENGITRRFSWKEAAAVQTFPPHLEFFGDLTSKYKQIGNAVPVKQAESIAAPLYEALSKIKKILANFLKKMNAGDRRTNEAVF